MLWQHELFIPCIPCPAPRMTQADRWQKRPIVVKYFKQRDNIKAAFQRKPRPGSSLEVIFFLPIPKSLEKKVKDGDPHTTRPDIDNLFKGLLDALFTEDGHINHAIISKIYSNRPGILVKY